MPLNRRNFIKQSAIALDGVALLRSNLVVVGASPKNLVMFAKPEGRIHFAGEHLSFDFSWMQGALESSARAVKQIHEASQAVGQFRVARASRL